MFLLKLYFTDGFTLQMSKSPHAKVLSAPGCNLMQSIILQQQKTTIMKSIYHRFLIKAPAQKVYEALTTQEGLSGWWTPETKAKPEVGSISRFAFGDYFKEMRIETLEPSGKIKWTCIKGFEDWIGTTITFELQPNEKGTVLFFHHDNWKEYTPEFASCSYDWAMFLRSMRLLCETGKGLPYPDQYK